jgi:hypothetical protein
MHIGADSGSSCSSLSPLAVASWLLPFPVSAVFILMNLNIRSIGIPCATTIAAIVYYSVVIWYSLRMVILHVFLEIAGLAPAAVFSEFKFGLAMLATYRPINPSTHGRRAMCSCGYCGRRDNSGGWGGRQM